MFRLLFDFGIELIWTRINSFDWNMLIVVNQEVGEILKDLLLC